MEKSIAEESKTAKKSRGQKRQPEFKFISSSFDDTYGYKPVEETPNTKSQKNMSVKKVQAKKRVVETSDSQSQASSMNIGEVKFMKNSSNLEIPVPKSARKGNGKKKSVSKNEEEKKAEQLQEKVRKVIEVCDGIFV